MLAIWHNAIQANLITPVDPETGQPLCNVEPVRAGKQYFASLSPDGKTLAITISNREDGGGARLHLLDLVTWQLAETPIEFDGWVGPIAFSPDGRQLAVTSSGPAYGAQGTLYGTQLALVDLESQKISAETGLDFNPRLLKYLPDGSALVLYGGHQNQEYLAVGDPTVVLLDASDLNEVWKTTLPGVLEGAYQDEAIEGPEGLVNWAPGLAFSPRSLELLIVHADSDRLTKIDLAERSQGTVEIRRATSWLERLLALTAGVAHAKTLNGTTKMALLSPDGERLYVVGVSGDTQLDVRGDWTFEESWQGLQVIDPASGAEIAHLDVNSSDMALSGDGTQIFLRGWDKTTTWTDVVEAEDLETLGRLKGRYLVAANTLDGDPLLLSNISSQHQTSLSLIDSNNLTEISHWRVWGYASWLIAP